MSEEALIFISDLLKEIVNYEFGQWTSKIKYPYWVGEYNEVGTMNEDGMKETTFILTGFNRGTWLELQKDKELIEKNTEDVKAILPNGNGIAIFFENALMIPLDDEELKKMQINLQIKEWRVM